MKIKYMGKLDPETNPLPTNKLKEGAIRFNEPTDRKKQNIQTSIVTFIIICIMFVPEYLNVLFRDVDSMDLSNLFSYFYTRKYFISSFKTMSVFISIKKFICLKYHVLVLQEYIQQSLQRKNI